MARRGQWDGGEEQGAMGEPEGTAVFRLRDREAITTHNVTRNMGHE